jgi:large subunit ribosomal protein L29
MKMKEILEKDASQIEQDLLERRKHLYELRTQAVTEKLEDPTQLGKTKKEIARLLTALRQRQIAQQKPTDNAGSRTSREKRTKLTAKAMKKRAAAAKA